VIKGGRRVRLTTSPSSVSRLSRENVGVSMSHNPIGLYGPVTGTALLFFLPFYNDLHNRMQQIMRNSRCLFYHSLYKGNFRLKNYKTKSSNSAAAALDHLILVFSGTDMTCRICAKTLNRLAYRNES
jgi:hypothetical protein